MPLPSVSAQPCQRIAQALFARVEVLGPTKVWLYLSEEAAAQGWATAMSGEFTAKVRRNGRGEMSRAYTSLVSVSIVDGNGGSAPSAGRQDVARP